jgi:hypothetical protein
MSNLVPVVIPDQIPAHLMKPEFMAVNTSISAGLPQGMFPMIGLKGTRFVIKNEGEETVLPQTSIGVVLLSAKSTLDKTYYAAKYDPNSTEVKSPDCFSKDGIRPDASAVLRQAEACAGCPMNQFGSGMDQNGNPGKGKACSDTKMLAIFAQGGVYGFRVPPASLKSLGQYIKVLTSRGIAATSCITIIGFDPHFSYPVLTFEFGGFLDPAQATAIIGKIHSSEVEAITGTGGAPSAPVQNPLKLVSAAVEPEVVLVTADPFTVATPTPPPATEKVKVVKAKTTPPPAQVATVTPDDADLAAALGLNL